MPTITSARLMNLVENRYGDSSGKSLGAGEVSPVTENGVLSPRHLYISPALYTTPRQSPLPENLSIDRSLASPYVVNHQQGRGLGPGDSQASDLQGEVEVVNGFADDEFDGENDDFKSEAEGSAVDYLSNKQIDASSVSAYGDFTDANEDFSEDGSGSSSPFRSYKLEEVLHATRLNVIEEIDRRRAAEDTVMLMQNQWERICILFSEAGLSFPHPPASVDMEINETCINQLLQELVVSKYVTEAIAGVLARAEAEEELNTIIMSKDQEMQRLQDRLQYYETVNHEMSQRKLVEVARRHQHKKKIRRIWIWSLMGLSVAAVGASLVAYGYVSDADQSVLSNDSTSENN